MVNITEHWTEVSQDKYWDEITVRGHKDIILTFTNTVSVLWCELKLLKINHYSADNELFHNYSVNIVFKDKRKVEDLPMIS